MEEDNIKYPDFSEEIERCIKEDIGIDFKFVSDEEYHAMSIEEQKHYDREKFNYWDWCSIIKTAMMKGYRESMYTH